MREKLFIAGFFLLCLIPLAGLLILGPAEPAANETAPVKPSLTDSEGKLNRQVLNDFSAYLEKAFAFRQEMVTTNHALTAALFGVSPEDDVILGKGDWLFYGETLDDYEGVHTMTDQELQTAVDTLVEMQNYCASRGVEFYFTVPPNKNSLYGDRMPDRYPAGEEYRNLTRLAPLLEEAGVNYVDLLTPLSRESNVLYRAGDSHWTQEGAGLAGDILLTAMGRSFQPFYGGRTDQTDAEGDLLEILYPVSTPSDQDTVYLREFTFTYTSPIRSAEDNFIRTTRENAQGSLLMFRDSFGNALHPFLAEAFGSATFCRLTPYDLSLIDTEGADTVVIELVERNLDWLITRPPVIPAYG